ncbi:MAG: RHS repeat protein [Phycisphaeraceae bacterium]|nr:RHS repeat protein [Phycisphaeraceae bacterium]
MKTMKNTVYGLMLMALTLASFEALMAGTQPGVSVESVLRAYNRRYEALNNGEHIPWPMSADGKRVAPAFPKDGWYGSQLEDRHFRAALARYFDDVFFGVTDENTKIYDEFYKVEGMSEGPFPQYYQNDFDREGDGGSSIHFHNPGLYWKDGSNNTRKLTIDSISPGDVKWDDAEEKVSDAWAHDDELVACSQLGDEAYGSLLAEWPQEGYDLGQASPAMAMDWDWWHEVNCCSDMYLYARSTKATLWYNGTLGQVYTIFLAAEDGDEDPDSFAAHAPVKTDGKLHRWKIVTGAGTWCSAGTVGGQTPEFDAGKVCEGWDTSTIGGGGSSWSIIDQQIFPGVLDDSDVNGPNGPGDGDGDGDGDDGEDDDECSNCTTDCPNGASANPSLNGSLKLTLSLGGTTYGTNKSAGRLVIHAEEPAATIWTPEGLDCEVSDSVDVVAPSGPIRQVWTGRLLADVITDAEDISLGAYEYEVRYYIADDVGTKSTLYPLNQGATPFYVVNIDNLNTSTDNEHIRITESLDEGSGLAVSKINDYVWNDTEEEWELYRGLDTSNPTLTSAERRTLRTVTYNEDHSVCTVVTSRFTATGSTPVSKVQKELTQYPWGWELTKYIVDPDGAALTDTWSYYDTADEENDNNYSFLKMHQSPSGYWEHYEYDDEAQVSRKIVQLDHNPYTLEDDVFEPIGLDAFANQNIAYEYSVDAPAILFVSAQNEEEVVVEKTVAKAAGVVKEVSYRIYRTASDVADTYEVWDVQCVTTDPEGEGEIEEFIEGLFDGSDTTGHLITRTWKWEEGQDHQFQVAQVLRPDKTMTFYDRSTPGTTVVTSGFTDPSEPNPTAGDVVEGTETTSVVDENGLAISTKTRRIERGGNWFTVSLVLTANADAYGRPTLTEYYFGDEADTPASYDPAYTTSKAYGCCGVENEIDRAGFKTEYEYDGLGRQNLVTAPTEIETGTYYDATGRVTATTRKGAGEQQAIFLQGIAYDVAGRVTLQMDGDFKNIYYVYREVGGDGVAYTNQDERYQETRVYPHDTNSGPIQVTWTDPQGRMVRQWTASTTATWSSQSPPSGGEALTELSRTVTRYDWNDRPIELRTYHDLADYVEDEQGETPLDLDEEGEIGTNYYVSTSEYDVLGREWKTVDPSGDITLSIYDNASSHLLEQWKGTDDTGATTSDPDGSGSPNNMARVSRNEYYFVDIGDDQDYEPEEGDYYTDKLIREYHLASIDTAPSAIPTDYVATDFDESWDTQNEWRISWSKPQASGGPWTKQVYNYQGQLLESLTYENDSGSLGDLLAKTKYEYDDDSGQLTASWVYEVTGGTPGNYLETTYFYEEPDGEGLGGDDRQVKVATSGGGFTKTAYDAHGRVLRTVTGALEGATTDYYGANAFADDILLTETVYEYDNTDNVILTTTYTRNHDAGSGVTGLLSASSDARVSYTATWYDNAHRPTHVAEYGTNDGATGAPPSP